MTPFASRLGLRTLLSLFSLLLALNASAGEVDPVVERIKSTGLLRIAFNPANGPFSFPGPDGQPVGYTIDLCKLVAQKMGPAMGLKNPLKIEYRPIKSSERLPLITTGAIDLECSASTNTLERQKSVAYSVSFFTATGRMLVNKGAGIKSYQDLSPKHRIVVVKGTTGQVALPARLNTIGRKPTIIEVGNQADAQAMLQEGKADGYVTDDVLLYAVRAKLKDPGQWEVIGKSLSVEPYGMMMPKGAPQFEKLVDDILREAFANGVANNLYQRWFLTKEFEMPMSHLTREALKWPNKIGVGKAF